MHKLCMKISFVSLPKYCASTFITKLYLFKCTNELIFFFSINYNKGDFVLVIIHSFQLTLTEARCYKIEMHPVPSKNIESNHRGQGCKDCQTSQHVTFCKSSLQNRLCTWNSYKYFTNRHMHVVILFLMVHLCCSLHHKNDVLKTFPVGAQLWLLCVFFLFFGGWGSWYRRTQNPMPYLLIQ